MMKWWLHIVFVLISGTLFAQQLNTHLSKPSIQIGEPVTITFSIQASNPFDSVAYIPQNGIFKAKSSASGDTSSISTEYELEVMQLFEDTTYKEGGKYIWKGVYRVTGWDSAYVAIPPERIIVDDSLMYFPAALLEVGMPAADPSKPIHDINESFTEVDEEKGFMAFLKSHWWWMLIALIVLIFVIWKLFPKREKKSKKELSLRERTLKEIDELEKSKSYESNLKEYYFDLSIIVRRFFSEHFEERMLDKTSKEIEELLAQKGLRPSTVEVVHRILNQSDLVKFAKSEPPISEVFVITNDARRVINEIASLAIDDE